MAVPTFGGVACFGIVESMHTEGDPKAIQENAFAGVNGIQTLDGGTRGGRSQVQGAILADNVTNLGTAMASLQALQQTGTVGTFTDQFGATYDNCYIRMFKPVGKTMLAPGFGVLHEYEMTIRLTS